MTIRHGGDPPDDAAVVYLRLRISSPRELAQDPAVALCNARGASMKTNWRVASTASQRSSRSRSAESGASWESSWWVSCCCVAGAWTQFTVLDQ